MVEQTADMVLITDNKGVIEYIHSAFERDTGYTRGEVIGKTPSILNSSEQDQAFYKEPRGTTLAGQVYRGVIINRRSKWPPLNYVKPQRWYQANILATA